MARGVKPWLRRSAGQAAAVLILLSATGDCLQCYWCGPRAEQVHRSQRAPSCDEAPDQMTVCDPGYTHCAVVATSPPFAESRHCVRFYQDECYAQYCNSTRSYRMTCPCRGDLCNGPNTARETEAFAALTEIVANARIKRNTIASSFISADKTKVNNLIENEDQESNADANNANNETIDSVTQTEPPTSTPAEHSNDSSIANNIEVNSTPEAETALTEAVKTVETTTQVTEEKPDAMEVASATDPPIVELTTTKVPETSIKPEETMKVEVKEFVSNEIKPSMQLPTAEALQQNASPIVTTEKPMEQTTSPTTLMMTENDSGTPMPTKSKNNSAVASLSTFVFLSSLAFKVSS